VAGGKSVLVVDDQSSIRYILKQMLIQLGHRAETVADGEAALRRLNDKQDIDIMLCDVQMEKVNGMEVLKSCHNLYPNMPVILMSAYTRDSVIVEALRLGACDYLIKPFEIRQLRDVIDRVNEIYSQRHRIIQHQELINEMTVDFEFKSKNLPISQMQSLIKSTIHLYSGAAQNDLLNISVAFEEALLNAHEHGNLELESGWKEDFRAGESVSMFEKIKEERLQIPKYCDRKVRIQMKISQERIALTIEDSGKGYPVGQIGSQADGKPFGMGLMLIQNLMDKLSFNEAGNAITFEKYIKRI